MSMLKRPHVSKTGKSILAFRRPSLTVQQVTKSGPNGSRTPAVPVEMISDPTRVYGK